MKDILKFKNERYWIRTPGMGDYQKLEITQIITDGADCYPWREYFAILPRKTITGRQVFWERAFKRRVWVVWGIGFHMEPQVQYATFFDLIENGEAV